MYKVLKFCELCKFYNGNVVFKSFPKFLEKSKYIFHLISQPEDSVL